MNSLDASEIVAVNIMMFKKNQQLPCHKYNIDMALLGSDDYDAIKFKKRLINEGVNEVRKKIGLMRTDVQLGYWKKENGKMIDFRESFNNSQWGIALKRVLESPEVYSIAGMYLMIKDQHANKHVKKCRLRMA